MGVAHHGMYVLYDRQNECAGTCMLHLQDARTREWDCTCGSPGESDRQRHDVEAIILHLGEVKQCNREVVELTMNEEIKIPTQQFFSLSNSGLMTGGQEILEEADSDDIHHSDCRAVWTMGIFWSLRGIIIMVYLHSSFSH